MTNCFLFCSYILKVPFDKEDSNGIVYVWIGEQSDPEEDHIAVEIARNMYDTVSIKNMRCYNSI